MNKAVLPDFGQLKTYCKSNLTKVYGSSHYLVGNLNSILFDVDNSVVGR